MAEESERGEMEFNLTTTQLPPLNPKPRFPGYYALILLMLLILIGCVVAMVIYIRRRARIDELRHRLIPLYSYDPTEEEEEWREAGREDEDQELTEPLYKEGKLAFSSDLLGPRWFLTSILLATAALSLDSLLCHYCPLQHKSKSCPNITSQCLPDQRCSSSRGRYGSIHVLSAQGCVDTELCGSHEIMSYRGVKYNVSHTCCCRDGCNIPPKADASLKVLLGMIADKLDGSNITGVLSEELWGSCANYTS